jgi:hypothetical protein
MNNLGSLSMRTMCPGNVYAVANITRTTIIANRGHHAFYHLLNQIPSLAGHQLSCSIVTAIDEKIVLAPSSKKAKV